MALRRRHPLGRVPRDPVYATAFGVLDFVWDGSHHCRAWIGSRLELVVSDIDAAREDVIRRGVEVSELFHRDESGLVPGPEPQRRSYRTYASFSDPDGNSWLLQEVKERVPGRVWDD